MYFTVIQLPHTTSISFSSFDVPCFEGYQTGWMMSLVFQESVIHSFFNNSYQHFQKFHAQQLTKSPIKKKHTHQKTIISLMTAIFKLWYLITFAFRIGNNCSMYCKIALCFLSIRFLYLCNFVVPMSFWIFFL